MRHHIVGYQLNRDSQSRRALFKNLITALITHGTIETTEAKAKAIRSQMDKLVTKAKRGTLNDQRQINKVVNRRAVVRQLVTVIAPATKTRSSGFTRIVKLNYRPGDAALKVRLEFVDKLPVKATEVEVEAKSKKTVKDAPKAAKVTPSKTPAVLPGKLNQVTPMMKPQVSVKPGQIRQKSGER